MIVKVNVEHVVLPGALTPDEARMLRTAVARAVQQHVTRAAGETRSVRPASIERASQAAGTEIVARCSRSSERSS